MKTSNNTHLTRELAIRLIRAQEVPCPKCKKSILASRYTHKNRNVVFKCPNCGEVYHPCKMI